MTRLIRVLCVDDNPLVAEALAMHLEGAGGFDWIGQRPDATSLASAAVELAPDLVLLDVDMPGPDPLEALVELGRIAPSARVVVLSGHVRRELVDRALEAGAWGYLSKGESPRAILEALRRVHAGEVVIGSDARASLGG